MSENQQMEQDNIIYLINEKEKTASVVGCNSNNSKIFLPASINYELNEYPVTSIKKKAFEFCSITSIEFSENSKLQTIEEYAFNKASIESITIPSEVTFIGYFAFSYCYQLQHIEFSKESKLQIIEERAFSGTSIKSIKIPSEVIYIGERAFSNCHKLQYIEFSNESKLQAIGEYAFDETLIESITIPSSVTDLIEGWCGGFTNLKNIKISPSNQQYRCHEEGMIIGKSSKETSNFDCFVFCFKNIKNITIPDSIKYISAWSFSGSSIKSITIPSEVTYIGESAFSNCYQLQHIDFSNESKLQTIGADAFFRSAIKSIAIPSEVTFIGDRAFYYCWQLKIIELNEKFNIDSINLIFSKPSFFMCPVSLHFSPSK